MLSLLVTKPKVLLGPLPSGTELGDKIIAEDPVDDPASILLADGIERIVSLTPDPW